MTVVTKFTADGCPKCRMLAPMFNRLASEFFDDGVAFLDCDIDTFPEQAKRCGVMTVPVILVERNGKEVERIEGVIPESVLRSKIAAWVQKGGEAR